MQLDKEGFSQVFARRTKDTREGRLQSDQIPGGSRDHGPEPKDNSPAAQEDRREPPQEATGYLPSRPGSSRNGSHGTITLSNRFAQLEDSKRAEEVATKADQDKEEQVRDGWDQESRLEDLAHRKQSWHAAKFRKLSTHHTGRGVARSSQGSGPQGSEGGGIQRRQSASGSSVRATKGPEAAGGPGATEPPSAKGGGDREERAAPPGRLAPGVGRQAGLPEPFAAPMVTGEGQGLGDRFSTGLVHQALHAGAMPSASLPARPCSGNPGRAIGRSDPPD